MKEDEEEMVLAVLGGGDEGIGAWVKRFGALCVPVIQDRPGKVVTKTSTFLAYIVDFGGEWEEFLSMRIRKDFEEVGQKDLLKLYEERGIVLVAAEGVTVVRGRRAWVEEVYRKCVIRYLKG